MSAKSENVSTDYNPRLLILHITIDIFKASNSEFLHFRFYAKETQNECSFVGI